MFRATPPDIPSPVARDFIYSRSYVVRLDRIAWNGLLPLSLSPPLVTTRFAILPSPISNSPRALACTLHTYIHTFKLSRLAKTRRRPSSSSLDINNVIGWEDEEGKGIGNGVTSWGQRVSHGRRRPPRRRRGRGPRRRSFLPRRGEGEEIIKPRSSGVLVVSRCHCLGYLASVIVPGMRILNGKAGEGRRTTLIITSKSICWPGATYTQRRK